MLSQLSKTFSRRGIIEGNLYNIEECNVRKVHQIEIKDEGKSKIKREIGGAPRGRNLCHNPLDDGNELLKILRPNTFDKSILGFCHSILNFRSGSKRLECSLTIQLSCDIRYDDNSLLKNKKECKRMTKHKKYKYKRKKRENYLVQEFDKVVQDKGIPSRVLMHFGLVHFVVGHGNEVLELLKLHFSKYSNAK